MDKNNKEIKTVDQYIAQFPAEVQDILEKIRKTVKNEAPQAVERISYQMPTYTLNRNLVHFAAYKKHIGFYPAPDAIRKFKSKLKKYKTSTGTLQFPLGEPIPYDLIAEIVRYRVGQDSAKK